jgi:hypothetical protein
MATAMTARISDRPQVHAERLFYVIASGLMLVLTAGGFRLFILHGKGIGGGEITSQIFPLVVAHGLAMFGWVAVFFIQSLLILTGNQRLHMRIGPAGAVIAAAIVGLGPVAASLSARFNPELYKPFGGPSFFLATMLTEIFSFGGFVLAGMLYRHRPEIHRPMMLMATFMIISGSLGRFPYIDNWSLLPPLYVWGPVLVFGALLFLLHWAMTRAASRWYATGYAALLALALLSVLVGHTGVWTQVAGLVIPASK